MLIDPIAPIMVHNLAVCGTATIACCFYPKKHLVVFLSFLAGSFASFQCKGFSSSFFYSWREFFYEPVFEGKLFREPNGEVLIGFFAFWVSPIVFAYLVVFLMGRKRLKT
jgi:hypothetical protein